MLCGLIGEKLSHSYSKLIHNLLADYQYELFSIPPNELKGFIEEKHYRGLNVTIPYKKTVIPFCDSLSDTAKSIGSVNTLVLDGDQKIHGHNTDYDGFLYMTKRAGISFKGKKVLVLGSGGTSLTARYAAREQGAREIIAVSRTGQINYDQISDHFDSEVIVNTTPVGMYPQNGGNLLSLERFNRCCGVLDVIYNPLRTRLILQAKYLHIPCSGGLSMLVAQAKAAAELFLGQKIPDTQTEAVLRKLLASIENIVLIGMPGSGKTQVGQRIAALLSREFLDVDEQIEKKADVSIPEIFEKQGEAAFRTLEKKIIEDCGKINGRVIATGGGAVLNPENYYSLSQNGRIYFIKRPLSRLAINGRPLSKDIIALRGIYKERFPLYLKYSHATILNNRSIQAAAKAAVEEFYETTCDKRAKHQYVRHSGKRYLRKRHIRRAASIYKRGL